MNARLLTVHFAPVAEGDERQLVLCDVEIVNDSIVAHAKPEFVSPGHSIMRKGFEAVPHVVDFFP